MKLKIAKIIRIIFIPPVLVAALLLFLFFLREDVVPQPLDLWLSILLLAVVPVLAYPLQKIIPAFRKGGRKLQRRLAFILSLCGYTAALVSNLARGAVQNLTYISAVYLASVVILTVFNTFTPFRASGHACSIMGPMLLLPLFLGWPWIFPCVAVYALTFWASVLLGRHTVREFLLGSLSAVISTALMYPIFRPVF